MQLSGKFLKYEDVVKIASFLKEEGYANHDFTINVEVEDKRTLNKINEDYFYRIPENKNSDPTYGDEVLVTVDNINFVYKIHDSEEE